MKMKSPSVFHLLICLSGFVTVLGLSVIQTPEKINTSEGANVAINCHIEADSKSDRIKVLWLKNNLTDMHRETFNLSEHRLSSGNASFNATLHLTSIHLNHTAIYYCRVFRDVPILEIVYGQGTHVYVVRSSSIVTPSPALTISSPTNSSDDTLMMSSLSGLGILLFIICIALVIYMYYKRHYKVPVRVKEALVDASAGSQCPVAPENVVYAALNIPKNQGSIKTRTENSTALVSATETCTEETITYSEVHVKREPKDEG